MIHLVEFYCTITYIYYWSPIYIYLCTFIYIYKDFPGGSQQCGRPGFDPWVGRSPGEGNGYPLQYSGLENSMDCTVHGVTKSLTQQRLSLTYLYKKRTEHSLKFWIFPSCFFFNINSLKNNYFFQISEITFYVFWDLRKSKFMGG